MPETYATVYTDRAELRIVVMRLKMEIEKYRIALSDAIRCPMGTVPDSADGLVSIDDIQKAENRRTNGKR